MISERPTFLIIETAFLGDVILSTSLAEKIHASFPKSPIDYLIKKGHEQLFYNHPFIRNIYAYNKKRKIIDGIRVINQLRKNRYTYLINAHRHFSSGIISLFCKSANKVGYTSNPISFGYSKRIPFDRKDGRHVIHRYHDLIEHLTDGLVSKPKLYPKNHGINDIKGSYICIAPCSKWKTKEWPHSNWEKFISQLPSKYAIYLLGGKEDYHRLEEIKLYHPSREIINTSDSLTMLESIAVMKGAAMNFVLDSAPLHMASAVNAPVTAIYISTDPTYGFTPLSDNHTIIQTTNNLACRPCGSHGHNACPKRHFKCAEIEITALLLVLPTERKNH